MSQFVWVGLLMVTVLQDWPRTSYAPTTANQRVQELHNRHDRRFRADWGTRNSPRSRSR